MTIEILEVYGRSEIPGVEFIQFRGRVLGEREAYNVAIYAWQAVLAAPRHILVRRSSWAGKYGDGGGLPF